MSPLGGGSTGSWNSNAGQGNTPNGYTNDDFGYKNYRSRLPEVYTGHPNRIERYNQYEMMDVDAEINACLDIIAEFSTQKNEHNKTPFNLNFKNDMFDLAVTGQVFFFEDNDLGNTYRYKNGFRAYFFAGLGAYYSNPKTWGI
jgi:hypothetical protein